MTNNKEKMNKLPRKEKTKKPKIDISLPAPMSELLESMPNVQVLDMEAIVEAPLEERRKQALKASKVTRPRNSFILYRIAYSDATRKWSGSHNHQDISSIAGASWGMEPLEVKNKFEGLAERERINHAAAHPGYKFSPNKNNSVAHSKTPKSVKDELDHDDIYNYNYNSSRSSSSETESSFGESFSRTSCPLSSSFKLANNSNYGNSNNSGMFIMDEPFQPFPSISSIAVNIPTPEETFYSPPILPSDSLVNFLHHQHDFPLGQEVLDPELFTCGDNMNSESINLNQNHQEYFECILQDNNGHNDNNYFLGGLEDSEFGGLFQTDIIDIVD